MTLASMITAIGEDIDRSDIDTKITKWIQEALNWVHNKAPMNALQRAIIGSTVTDSSFMLLPVDFSDMHALLYTPGDGTGYPLEELDPTEFLELYSDPNVSSKPIEFTIFENQILLGPRPDSTYAVTLYYRISPPNIFTHDLTITYNAAPGTPGVQIYLDEDAYGLGYGKLYFVSPTSTNALVRVETADGHEHDITIYHSASAATLGVAWYFDDDATDETKRNLFVGANGVDCVVRTNGYRSHAHFIKFVDDSAAATNGSAVYCDEDVADKQARLLSDNAGDADATSELVLSEDGSLPPFPERFHEAIQERAIAKGHNFNKNKDDANTSFALAETLRKEIIGADKRRIATSVKARSFGAGRINHGYNPNRFPEINDGLS